MLTLALRIATAAALLSLPAFAQSGRTMTLTQPVQIGKTAELEVAYPPSAIGNPAWFMFSGPFVGTTTLPVPGFSAIGDVRINPATIFGTGPYIANGAGSSSMLLPIPADMSFVGVAFDVQTLDVDAIGRNLYWSDNDLELVLSETGCGNPLPYVPLYTSSTPK